MKYIDEFRNKNAAGILLKKIRKIAPSGEIKIMEVCGTHTQSFFRFGLAKLLPANIKLIAGPGCPVCVSPQTYIDTAIKLAQGKDIIIATFGDMLRVPGSGSTLEKERGKGAGLSVVYSPWDSLELARQNAHKKVVFLAVGFETTAPAIALTILAAKKEKLKNLFFFSSLKLIPPAMRYLLQDRRLKIKAFLCPGHVSSVIGSSAYEFIPRKYRIACCVAGFEPLDILSGIYSLLKQLAENKLCIANEYSRAVSAEGNKKAQRFMRQVFEIKDAHWRGLGKIPKSGLKIRNTFGNFDAEKAFDINLSAIRYTLNTKCKCGGVLKGLIISPQCPLFAKICRPDNPIGPCMISSEGACNVYYKYK